MTPNRTPVLGNSKLAILRKSESALTPDDPCLRAYRIGSVCDAGMEAQDSPWMRGNLHGPHAELRSRGSE
jgi:hypothetical protein